MNDITYAVSVDVNNPTIPYNVYIASVLDSNVRYLEITLYQNGNVIALSNEATATASLVTDNVLVDDSVNCTISDNIITVPLEGLQRHGNLDVQVTVTEGTKVLAIPFPIQVRVTPNIAENAQIDENSLGSYAEVVHEIAEARGTYTTLHDAIAAKMNKLGEGSAGMIILSDGSNGVDRSIYSIATSAADGSFNAGVTNKVPTVSAVEQRINGKGFLTAHQDISEKEDKSNKVTSLSASSTDIQYPSAKAVYDALEGKANSNHSHQQYLTSHQSLAGLIGTDKVYEILDSALSGDPNIIPALLVDNTVDQTHNPDGHYILYYIDSDEVRHNIFNFTEYLHGVIDSTLSVQGAAAEAAVTGAAINGMKSDVEDIKAYLGYDDEHIVGLQADFKNKVFKRLAGAAGLSAGSDFDAFPMYGGRRRCNVAADGTINAYYGDEGYIEDGTNGQVMVYQPVFWYKVVPLDMDRNTSGVGYHIRKANYYVSSKPKVGFKRHPLFYDALGNPVDYVLLSAYEGSMYDVSEEAYVNDSVDTSVSYGAGDLLCSVAGKKPISGKLNNIGTKGTFETMANNIGSGWHLNTIKAENANQLLMMIELGTLNTQTAIGRGVVDQSGSSNASSLTGSTASLGNATGMASSTIAESAGTETTNTTNGNLSVSYRGVENPWGNIWKHTNGINLWGDGTMGGGQVFICDDFTYNESKHDGNYQSAGFSIANGNGYISAFGYGSEDYDWVLMPSEVTGNSTLPVGDYCYVTPNLSGYRIALLGGYWVVGASAGGFCWYCGNAPGIRSSYFGGRLLYVPTATV